MADSEPFTLVEESQSQSLYPVFQDLTSAKNADHDVQYTNHLRRQFPELTVTAIPSVNVDLLRFARAGHAVAELDNSHDDPLVAWRGWVPALGRNEKGGIAQTIFFAKYHYRWGTEDFVVYTVSGLQYVLKEPRGAENALSSSKIVDGLITAAGTFQSADNDVIWVYDSYWTKSKPLWEQVQKAEWANVILDEDMKRALTAVSTRFFDSEAVYHDLGVAWKRGIIFHGPPGNGKTVSLKALMHTLLRREPSIPTLYVKTAPNQYHLKNVFNLARRLSPCLLVFEDIDTIVTKVTRSYFFNEVDGLESNDGILMVASTNYLDKLDPGLSKRPSRFDRKYLFPLPDEHQRTLYADYWRQKLGKKQNSIDFPRQLCKAMAGITDDFSFAYMQEAFVASLLVLARKEDDDALVRLNAMRLGAKTDNRRDLDGVELWRVFKEQVRILREDMDQSHDTPPETREVQSEIELLSPEDVYRPDEVDVISGVSHATSSLPGLPLPEDFNLADMASQPAGNVHAMLDMQPASVVGTKGQVVNTSAFLYNYRPY